MFSAPTPICLCKPFQCKVCWLAFTRDSYRLAFTGLHILEQQGVLWTAYSGFLDSEWYHQCLKICCKVEEKSYHSKQYNILGWILNLEAHLLELQSAWEKFQEWNTIARCTKNWRSSSQKSWICRGACMNLVYIVNLAWEHLWATKLSDLVVFYRFRVLAFASTRLRPELCFVYLCRFSLMGGNEAKIITIQEGYSSAWWHLPNVCHPCIGQLKKTCRVQNPDISPAGRAWAHSGVAGCGQAGLVANRICRLCDKPPCSVKASRRRCLNVTPEGRTSEILFQPINEHKPRLTTSWQPVELRFFLCGLSAGQETFFSLWLTGKPLPFSWTCLAWKVFTEQTGFIPLVGGQEQKALFVLLRNRW